MSNLIVPQPFCDQVDGSPNFDGTTTVLGLAPSSSVYTLNANVFADTITIRTGVRVAAGQYAIMCRKLVIESGAFLSANGNNAAGATAGAAITAAGYLGWAAGGGGAGVSRTTVGSTNGNNGSGSGGANVAGTGGNGGTGGAGVAGVGNASAVAVANQFRVWRSPQFAALGWKMPPTSTNTGFTLINGGGGGGSGGIEITAQTGVLALTGGAGGGAGGLLYLSCGILQNAGTIEALGGNGGNATTNVGITGNAGGGGGGAGGSIHATVQQIASLGTFKVSGGTGGTGVGAGATINGISGTVGTLALFVRGEAI